jgi:hypothetical protein
MNTLELDDKLNALIIQGRTVEAFETYYAEHVVAQENEGPERHGRDAWLRARQDMERGMRKFNARMLANAASGDTSFSEWVYDVELEGMGAMHVAQVAVRHWKDGRVVRERFYHQ